MLLILRSVLTAVAIFCFGFRTELLVGERKSIAPFLSGDTFLEHADYVFDENYGLLNFKRMQFGTTIFVKTDLLPRFFEQIHPHIVYPYVLITHNSEESIPGDYDFLLGDDKVLAWFGNNVEDCVHPKLHPIPTGLANYCWPFGHIESLVDIRDKFSEVPKKHLLYMNFNRKNRFIFRSDIYYQFIHENYCFSAKDRSVEEYFSDIASSFFVLSPRGNALDCHRTWEALYLGAIPIVGPSSLDPIFRDLPVVVTQNWKEIDFPFLAEKLDEIKKQNFSCEPLWADYWFKQIDAYKNMSLPPEEKKQIRGKYYRKKVKKLLSNSFNMLKFYLQNASKDTSKKSELERIYLSHCKTSSDINEHLPILDELSRECSGVVQIGVSSMAPIWGILQGLSESPFVDRFYLGIDPKSPPRAILEKVREIAESEEMSFQFQKGSDMEIDIPLTDMLFIDFIHTYCHLTYELEKFSSKVRKYIVVHDTSDPWSSRDDDQYRGDYSEYDSSIDRQKRGLWPAIEDFLEKHPEWCLLKRRLNNHGLTILKRIDDIFEIE